MKNIAIAISTLALLACTDPTQLQLLDSDPDPDLDEPAVSSDNDPAPETLVIFTTTGPLIAWDFGNVQLGALSPALVLTVVNNTSTVSDVLQISFSGSNAGQFTLNGGTDCVGAIQLAPGGSCSIRPRFAPNASGAKTTSLTINGGVAGSTSILLSGTGAPMAILSTEPYAFSFNVVEFGQPATKTFSLVNSGVAVAILAISVGGSINGGSFSVASTTCTGTLAVSASCSIVVRFDPQTFGDNKGNLTVTTDHGIYRIGNWVGGWGGARLTVQTTGTGTVYSNDGIYCGTDEDATNCTGMFSTPDHALAASGDFLGWGGACNGSAASCLVTLSTAETVVTANFAP